MKKTHIAAVLAAVLCTTAVWSQLRPGPPPMVPCPAMASTPVQGPMLDQVSKSLGLTSSQSAKLRSLSAKNMQTHRSLMQKSGEASKALHTALLAPTYDAKKVKDLASKAEKAEANVVSANINAWTQFRAILTKSQAAKLRKVMSAPGPRPGGPPPGSPPLGH